MTGTQLHCLWSWPRVTTRYRTGVSLHGHTFHSEEGLLFLDKLAHESALFRKVWDYVRARYRAVYGRELDMTRLWWTPPLSPRQAWEVERNQIEALDLQPLVSLSDHDNIQACLHLRLLHESRHAPISTEWTVPFAGTFFHIGVHNLPMSDLDTIVEAMREYTHGRRADLTAILVWLASFPGVLIVLNHPYWDEAGVGADGHRNALTALLDRHAGLIHALEINGLRPKSENRSTIAFAYARRMPVIAGGDRHAHEPSAVVNLTNATTFAEFAAEVRAGRSNVLFLNHYREAYRVRVVQNAADILADHDQHSRGWTRWTDRVFYRDPHERVRSLADAWGSAPPAIAAILRRLATMSKMRYLQPILRHALAEQPSGQNW